jgi:hypothetical protein
MKNSMENQGPDFIGIGVQRSASTWLHHHLRRYPGVWMAPIKELHYFSRNPAYPSPSYLAVDSLSRALLGGASHEREWRRHCRRTMWKVIRQIRQGSWPRTLSWYWRYFMGFPKTDDWYRSLFPAKKKLQGEISPAYSLLEEAAVARLAAHFPKLRVILFLRNPIDRSLSNYFLDNSRRPGFKHRVDDMLPWLNKPGTTLRNDYLAIWERWSRHFGPDRLFVGWYDDVKADPGKTLEAVIRFLGLPSLPEATLKGPLEHKINGAARHPVPEEVMLALARQYHPMLVSLADRLGGHAVRWLADCERILDGAAGAGKAAERP